MGGSALGLWDTATAQGVVSSLGMGLMMGSGLGVVIRDIAPKAIDLVRNKRNVAKTPTFKKATPAYLASWLLLRRCAT